MDSLNDLKQDTKEGIIGRFPWKQILIAGVILLLVTWWMHTPDGLLGKADAIGYAVCHRIDTRSFHISDRQIPLCARCTGQYLGAILGLIYLGILKPRHTGRPSSVVISILVVFVIVYVVDGINSYIHLIPGLSRFYLYEPNNVLRLATGTGLGLGISVMLYPVFNDTVLKKRIKNPVIENFWEFGLLLSLAIGVDLLVLTNNPIILYPLAILSAVGVMILLTVVYTMVVVMIFKIENSFETGNKFIIPLVAGFMISLLQISVLDYLRYVITGSWSGILFG
jgi:uncharacterized membrane protein